MQRPPPHIHECVGGGPVDLLRTDPPYGVDYTGSARKSRAGILNDNAAALPSLLAESFAAAASQMPPGAAFYIWCPSGPNLLDFLTACRGASLDVHQMLTWVKPRHLLSRSDYHSQTEACLHGVSEASDEGNYSDCQPCLYGWKPGAPHLWCSDRKQSNVLEFDSPMRSADHPTMKPVRLIAYQICNSSLPGAVVLDPFGGSGTTLIACEQTGRSCRMLELDPRYCDVIIRRWEALTGEKAVLLNG